MRTAVDRPRPPLPRCATIQPKARLGRSDDALELEADRIADAAVSDRPVGTIGSAGAAGPQRKCAQCAAEDEPAVRRKEAGSTGQAHGSDGGAVMAMNAVADGGAPLAPSLRRYFEPRFGRSFADVRLHHGAAAAAAASAIDARAYALGENIAFAHGEFNPRSPAGRHLIAHELAHVVQQRDGNPSPDQAQTVRRTPQRVTLATEGNCADPRAIAEAIPGALSMARTAFFDWFMATAPRDRARVDLLLRANFGADDQATRDTVHDRVSDIYALLQRAMNGDLTFVCGPANDPECGGREGYVIAHEPGRVHICAPFFNLTLEGRRWMLMHECAHLAGAMLSPESYWGYFGAIGEAQCRETMAGSTRDKLGNADNYARLIWCLTRQPGIVVTPT